VADSDPARVPLGTDEEAAGARIETHDSTSPHPGEGIGDAWILIAFILVFALIVLVWGLVIH
jgi:hypothetical protein